LIILRSYILVYPARLEIRTGLARHSEAEIDAADHPEPSRKGGASSPPSRNPSHISQPIEPRRPRLQAAGSDLLDVLQPHDLLDFDELPDEGPLLVDDRVEGVSRRVAEGGEDVS
jgi:hypothetical protein